MYSGRSRLPLVDLLKAAASQLIVWHHLAFYGPMPDVVHPYAPALLDWLYQYARVAVQVFLVTGGFLAARSLSASAPDARHLPRLLWRRYLRLARPYWIAVAAAALAAGTLPSLRQALAHVVFLQDILRQEALSAGVWYVAIDVQLFAILALVCTFARRYVLPAVLTLAFLSLFWFNRDPNLDIYAPYFFGAYGLGIWAEWIARQPRRLPWVLVVMLAVASALAVECRVRILVAGLTALALASGLRDGLSSRLITWLSDISYEVFLVHYPVLLLTGSVVTRHWPASPAANALGLVAAGLLSLGAGFLLHAALKTSASARTAFAGPDTRC